ncbi:MAG: hypothetical protein FJ206_03325 [Gemmatimonadetes bacterium]|nr:hypothetical protein [Gemmatimonadota bacterium]
MSGRKLLAMRVVAATGLGMAAQWTPASGQVGDPPAGEVRQIVTFLFQPGRAQQAQDIYRSQLVPIYRGLTDLVRFRAFREAESPEPLDLIVVSGYRGMAGMDRANELLRQPGPAGVSALALYGTLAAMTQWHHDQFAEMLPALSDPPDRQIEPGGELVVFEYLRLVPGGEGRLLASVRAERSSPAALPGIVWSETGRMLVSDGWDVLRIFGVRSLGDWHRYLTARRSMAGFEAGDRSVAARKTIIVRGLPDLAVR